MTQVINHKKAKSYRTYRKARDRALIGLSHLYPDTYKQLLAIERTFDEQEGKKWIGIDGLSNLTVGTHTRANGADSHVTLTTNKQENPSDNAGKA